MIIEEEKEAIFVHGEHNFHFEVPFFHVFLEKRRIYSTASNGFCLD